MVVIMQDKFIFSINCHSFFLKIKVGFIYIFLFNVSLLLNKYIHIHTHLCMCLCLIVSTKHMSCQNKAAYYWICKLPSFFVMVFFFIIN
jgi:hypothetical protein